MAKNVFIIAEIGMTHDGSVGQAKALINSAAEYCPSTPWVFFHIKQCRNTEVGDRIKDVKTAVRSACKRAELTGVTFHTLRHTCASWLGQMSGVEAVTIRDLLGHSSVTMTDRYMHSDQADLHDAVHKLEKFRSHSGHSAR